MKRKNYLIPLCILLILPFRSYSQSYTIEELKQGFYDQYVEKTIDASAYRVDSLMEVYKKKFTIHQDSQILCPCDSLHQVGKLRLPLSRFVLVTEARDEQVGLFWMNTLEEQDSVEYKKIRKQFVKKYGQKILDDGTELIPAKWFTGHIQILVNPFVYGGEVVSGFIRKSQIVDGEFQLKEDGNPYYASDFRDTPLARNASYIEKTRLDGKMEICVDCRPSREEMALKTAKGLVLFAQNINRCIDDKLLRFLDMKREYSVMLYLDESTLKAHLHPLLPRELTDEDRLLLTLLSSAVEQQPAGTFDGYCSERGFFPAIYLKAKYFRGHWSFEDYRFEEYMK